MFNNSSIVLKWCNVSTYYVELSNEWYILAAIAALQLVMSVSQLQQVSNLLPWVSMADNICVAYIIMNDMQIPLCKVEVRNT